MLGCHWLLEHAALCGGRGRTPREQDEWIFSWTRSAGVVPFIPFPSQKTTRHCQSQWSVRGYSLLALWVMSFWIFSVGCESEKALPMTREQSCLPGWGPISPVFSQWTIMVLSAVCFYCKIIPKAIELEELESVALTLQIKILSCSRDSWFASETFHCQLLFPLLPHPCSNSFSSSALWCTHTHPLPVLTGELSRIDFFLCHWPYPSWMLRVASVFQCFSGSEGKRGELWPHAAVAGGRCCWHVLRVQFHLYTSEAAGNPPAPPQVT